jgi:DNA-binding response OmpR family regulator
MSSSTKPAPTPTDTELDIKNILLLDDDVELAQTLKSLLEKHNFIVTTVENGADGLREIISLDFDVIICDMMMPKLPGDMFYLAVEKTKPELCDRFIFITGFADNPKVSQFLAKTKAQVLIKPVNTEDLLQAIAIVLRRNSG